MRGPSRIRRMSVLIGLTICMLAVTASAALDTSDAYVDGATTWAGTTAFSDPTAQLAGSIEWSVDWPTGSVYGADEFKYKYQITVTGVAPVSLLSIPMLSSNEANSIGSALAPSPATQIAPISSFFGGAAPALLSANWAFGDGDEQTPDELLQGDVSYELSYLSLNKPKSTPPSFGTLQNFGLGAVAIPLPAPSNEIPEPATMSLLALGVVGLVIRRRK